MSPSRKAWQILAGRIAMIMAGVTLLLLALIFLPPVVWAGLFGLIVAGLIIFCICASLTEWHDTIKQELIQKEKVRLVQEDAIRRQQEREAAEKAKRENDLQLGIVKPQQTYGGTTVTVGDQAELKDQ